MAIEPNAHVAGTGVTVKGQFFDEDGNPADPDIVVLAYAYESTEPTQFFYGDPGSPIVRDGVGLYEAEIDTSPFPGDGRVNYVWASLGNLRATSGLPTSLGFFWLVEPTVRPSFRAA